MASNTNILLILTLAFYVSNGSLLLSSSMRPNQPLQGHHHLEEHQYRQSRISKRQHFFDENEAERWLLYDKEGYNSREGLSPFGSKRHQWYDKAGNRPPWRKRNHQNEEESDGKLQKASDILSKNLASQHMLRTPRNHRTYDVPQIGE